GSHRTNAARSSTISSASMSRSRRRLRTADVGLRIVIGRRAAALLASLFLATPIVVGAQQQDTTAFYRALELESAGKYRDAAPLFRSALGTSSAVSALLGLERVYAELGWSDSLLAPLDTLIRRSPRETVYRSVQLRTLQTLGRDAELRTAIDRWVRDVPGDPSPYREYARLLLQRGLTASADSVIRQARQALGSTSDLQLEIAQLRAAMGLWEESAQAWRLAPELLLRAANAAVRSGDPSTALALLPVDGPGVSEADSARAARTTAPLQARALALMGRPAAAERLVQRFDRWLTPATRNALTRTIALGWVRSGDMARARASLSTAGSEGDSSDAAGWLALYEGNLRTAR